jgi:hypothetical protein
MEDLEENENYNMALNFRTKEPRTEKEKSNQFQVLSWLLLHQSVDDASDHGHPQHHRGLGHLGYCNGSTPHRSQRASKVAQRPGGR